MSAMSVVFVAIQGKQFSMRCSLVILGFRYGKGCLLVVLHPGLLDMSQTSLDAFLDLWNSFNSLAIAMTAGWKIWGNQTNFLFNYACTVVDRIIHVSVTFANDYLQAQTVEVSSEVVSAVWESCCMGGASGWFLEVEC